MRLIKNLPGLFKILVTVIKYFNKLSLLKRARASGNPEYERSQIVEFAGEIADYLCDKFHVNVKVRGRENIPDGPCLFVCNHQAYCDVVVLLKALKGHQTGFVAKDSVKKIPFFSKLMEAIRGIYIVRENPREAVKTIIEGSDLLKNGYSLVIFPEGTRSRSSNMGEFKAGSFKLATRAQVPVVPITLDGTYNNYEATGVLSPADVVVVIHEPISTNNLSKEETAEICKVAENQVRQTLEEIIRERV